MKRINQFKYPTIISLGALLLGIGYSLLNALQNGAEKTVPIIGDINFYQSIVYIFWHNFLIDMFVVSSGLLFYWLGTTVVTVNLFIFGYSLTNNLLTSGFQNTFLKYFHSLIEVPTIILSLSMSFAISNFLLNAIKGRELEISKKNVLSNILIYWTLLTLLIFIGAVIEACVHHFVIQD